MLKKTFVVAGAIAMLSLAAPAQADTVTSGNEGVLSGNQIFAPISLPINVCGVAASVIGITNAGCKGGSGVHNKW
ncbi:chaplin [Nonomuraea rhizosphaerae]|uniref:chaplin n=1 Tax=Nonomuraea rhizosphaerae TaxID=2665663 RepID=UPI001C5F1C77|nr:chaplin [Nonomuraea rhizosphaerae]